MQTNAALATLDTRRMANSIRALSMDAINKVRSGHPGLPLGAADLATVLFSRFLKYDPQHPDWADRDRFVLSAGHGSMLLYSLAWLTGYPGLTLDDIKSFRRLGSRAYGHPELDLTMGAEATTGPLGQGLAMAVGMALAERMLRQRFGADLVDHYTYALVGDGCLMEGISYEAAALAGHWQLGRLIVLFDDNRISIDGPTSLATSEDQKARFTAAGWEWQAVDGHDLRGDRRRHCRRQTLRTPEHHRLQDGDRSRPAQEGRHRRRPRPAADRRGGRRRPRRARLAVRPIRSARRRARGLGARSAAAAAAIMRAGRNAWRRPIRRRARASKPGSPANCRKAGAPPSTPPKKALAAAHADDPTRKASKAGDGSAGAGDPESDRRLRRP